MKRIAVLLLSVILLFCLCGCGNQASATQSQVTFYYLRSTLTYGEADSVIAPEVQDNIDRNNTLKYLLALYLNGPTDSRLYSPFPKDLEIESLEREADTLVLTFSDSLAKLKGMKLTKACACVALTCLGLTDARIVSIRAATETLDSQKSIDLTREMLVMLDTAEIAENGGTS